MNIFILTMVLITGNGSDRPVSIVTEYASKEKCEAAKEINRAALSKGSVVLATCTQR